MLKIYWADVSSATMNGELSLSDYRRRRLETIRHDMSRRCALGAEYLLIRAIREEQPDYPLPLLIETASFGKPFLSGGEYEFNLSHSDRYAACAISDRPVGLDIQTLSQNHDNLIRRCFSKEEKNAVILSKDPQEAFTRLWCRKESYLKRIGQGLRVPLSSFDVSGGLVPSPIDGKEYAFAECRVAELFFCVCMEKEALPDRIEPKKIALP